MTAALLKPVAQSALKRFRIRKESYYRMLEAGEFNGKRVELIDGEIFEMPAQSNWHGWSVKAATTHLDKALGPNFWVRVQLSLDLSPYSVPDPDVAVVRGGYEEWAQRNNPTSAILVVEVSETTLKDDREWKGSLYAASGIEDYWIVNLVQRIVEVYREPIPHADAQFGYRYAKTTTLDYGATVEMLAVPGVKINVTDLLPPVAKR